MKIYLVRHGKDREDVRGGWSSQPLTEEGQKQANELAKTVDFPVDAIYSSDLLRAIQTAEPLSRKLGISIVKCPEFREVNNGALAGMENVQALQQYPGLFWNTLAWEECYPGGESPRAFYERISTAWDHFQKKIWEKQENAVLVTHSGCIHVICSILEGKPYSNRDPHQKVGYTQVVPLEWKHGRWEEVEA